MVPVSTRNTYSILTDFSLDIRKFKLFLQKQITYLSRQKIHLLKFVNLKCVTLLKQITTEFISADRTESKHFKTILVLFLKNCKAQNCLNTSSENIFALEIKAKT